MSASNAYYTAQTEGTKYTMYAVMKMMGIPLTEHQAQVQNMLEQRYPEDWQACCSCPKRFMCKKIIGGEIAIKKN